MPDREQVPQALKLILSTYLEPIVFLKELLGGLTVEFLHLNLVGRPEEKRRVNV